jgi:hypothetical protein
LLSKYANSSGVEPSSLSVELRFPRLLFYLVLPVLCAALVLPWYSSLPAMVLCAINLLTVVYSAHRLWQLNRFRGEHRLEQLVCNRGCWCLQFAGQQWPVEIEPGWVLFRSLMFISVIPLEQKPLHLVLGADQMSERCWRTLRVCLIEQRKQVLSTAH